MATSHFLRTYEQFVDLASDTPQEFVHASGLIALSTISLGRRWIARGPGQIRPNLFVMLVADSSKDYKSTAVTLVTDVLREVEADRIGPTDMTAEGLVSYMRKRPGTGNTRNKLLLSIREFGKYLAASQSYNSGLSPVLCDLYDGESFERVRSGKKPIKIPNPRVSILAACAYGMLERYAVEQDWTTGFYARFAFVTPINRKARNPNIPPAFPADQRRTAIGALGSLSEYLIKAPGAMELAPDAIRVANLFSAAFQPQQHDVILQASRERLMIMVWKIAMLYQIDEDPSQPIGVWAMERACAFARQAWNAFLYVYASTAGSEFAREVRKVWQFVFDRSWKEGQPQEGATRRELMRRFHLNAERLLQMIDVLQKMEVIYPATDGRRSAFMANDGPSDPTADEFPSDGGESPLQEVH
jgi:hypothetical protein